MPQNPKVRDDDKRGAKPGTGTHTSNGGQIGQAPFIPTDEQRADVRTWAKINSQAEIAAALGISVATLGRHFKQELQGGRFEAVNMVGAGLLKKAMAGNLTAMIFYLRTQGKWNVRVEHTGADGGAIKHVDLSGVLAGMTDEQLELLQPLIEQLLTESGAGIDGGAGFGAGTDQVGEG